MRAVASSFGDQRGLRSVAAPAQLVARLKDVGFVLDEIERRHTARIDRWGGARPTQVGMSGHSFGALPPGDKAHLVLQHADQMTFGGQTGRAAEIVPRDAVTRDLQAQHHALVAAITTDWWRATLLSDALANARLITPSGLAPGDLWQRR